jgi:hypothetical protein
LAFPQAEIECPMYMEVPRGCNVSGNRDDYVLKLKKNLYGQKQEGKNWYNHMRKGLRRLGFKQSKVDECVFYKGNTIFFAYVDDGCFVGPDAKEIDGIIAFL